MDSAYQLWLLGLGVLNFGALAAFARRALGVSPLAAASAGALFAFCGPRLAEAASGHYQLYPQFWTPLALLCIALATGPGRLGSRRVAAGLVAPCLALQLWSSFYLGWFAVLALPFAVLLALALPGARAAIGRARPLGPALLAGGAVAALLLAPLASAYLEVASSVGLRSFDEVMVPPPKRWLYPGDASMLYGALAVHPIFMGIVPYSGHALGFGPLTSVLALVGFGLGRRQRWLVVLAATALVLMLLTTRVGDATAWRLVFAWVPGAGAIRAVARVALLVAIPVSLGVALALDRLRARIRRPASGAALAAGVGLLCLAEQAKYHPSFDKAWNRSAIRSVAVAVDPQACEAFHYVAIGGVFQPWKYSLDAMWASLEAGVPTVNGYSGSHPPGWQLDAATLRGGADIAVIDAALAAWVERNGLAPERVCRVRLRPRPEPVRGR
jgi:hypothetical protein